MANYDCFGSEDGLESTKLFLNTNLPFFGYPIMEEIRRQGKLCDVTLKVGNEQFTAHRIVLAAAVPYFHAMFTTDMVESKQDEIMIQGIEPSALEALVNYAYNGRVDLSSSNVQAILVGANFLQLQAVKEACCDFLKESGRSIKNARHIVDLVARAWAHIA